MSHRRLDRYVFRLFWARFFLAALALLSLYLSIETFEKLRWITRDGMSISSFLLLLWYKVPLALSQILPAASLYGAILTTTHMNRTRELTALCAAGISKTRAFATLPFAGLLVALLHFATTEYWVTAATASVRAVEARESSSGKSPADGGSFRWLVSDDRLLGISDIGAHERDQEPGRHSRENGPGMSTIGGVVAAESIEPDQRRDGNAGEWVSSSEPSHDSKQSRAARIGRLELLQLNGEGEVETHLLAVDLRWAGEGWSAKSLHEWKLASNHGVDYKPRRNVMLNIELPNPLLADASIDPNSLRFGELKTLIQANEGIGRPVTGARLALELRRLLPISCFLVLLVGGAVGARSFHTMNQMAAIAFALVMVIIYGISSGCIIMIVHFFGASLSLGLWLAQLTWLGLGILLSAQLRSR